MSERARFAWTVTAAQAGERLDRFLTARGAFGTRSQVQRLIAEGCIRVGDQTVKAGFLLRAGDEITAEVPVAHTPQAKPEAIPLDVLYEDEALLAINKPPGLVVHPAPGNWQGTLVSALLHRWPDLPPGFERGRLGIVHRLDKDTSGVLLVARTTAALTELGRQFRARTVEKRYLALVAGVPRRVESVIDAPIGRHPVQRKKMAVVLHGRPARTRCVVLERFAGTALVAAFPETGRTHQIRVHLAHIGHPVIGDPLYGRVRHEQSALMSRQALHAEAIGFQHPASGVALRITAPLATDFASALAHLRRGGRC